MTDKPDKKWWGDINWTSGIFLASVLVIVATLVAAGILILVLRLAIFDVAIDG